MGQSMCARQRTLVWRTDGQQPLRIQKPRKFLNLWGFLQFIRRIAWWQVTGGMFVSGKRYALTHGSTARNISIYGQERNPNTWKLAASVGNDIPANLASSAVLRRIVFFRRRTACGRLHCGLGLDSAMSPYVSDEFVTRHKPLRRLGPVDDEQGPLHDELSCIDCRRKSFGPTYLVNKRQKLPFLS